MIHTYSSRPQPMSGSQEFFTFTPRQFMLRRAADLDPNPVHVFRWIVLLATYYNAPCIWEGTRNEKVTIIIPIVLIVAHTGSSRIVCVLFCQSACVRVCVRVCVIDPGSLCHTAPLHFVTFGFSVCAFATTVRMCISLIVMRNKQCVYSTVCVCLSLHS